LTLGGPAAPEVPRAWFADWAVWALLAGGVAFLFSGFFQLFPIPGYVDAGMYQGYGLNFENLVRRYGFRYNSYHGSRLPYVLVLYLSHRLASPELGQYLQVIFFHLLTAASLLAVGYRGFGRGPALLGAAFLLFNPLFLSALTFGGADGAAVAYVALTAAFLFSSSGLAGGRAAMLAAGAGCALACAAHPLAFPALVGLLAGHLLAAGRGGWGLWTIGGLAAGGLLALAVLGAIGTTLGLKFFFLEYSFRMTRMMADGFGTFYFKPTSEWLFSNYRVLVPVVLGASALALLLARPAPGRPRLLRAALAALLLPFAVYVWLNASGRFAAVQARFYFTLLLPSLVLCVFAVAREALGAVSGFRMFGRVVLLGLPTVLVAAGIVSPPSLRTGAARVVFGSILGLGLVLAALLFAARRTGRERGASALVTAGLVLSASCLAVSEDSLQVYRVRTGGDYKEIYLGASRLVRVLEDSQVAASKPMFWFDRKAVNVRFGHTSTYYLRFKDQPLYLNYFDTLMSFYLWEPVRLGVSLRGVDAQRLNRLAGRPVVYLGLDRAACEEALRHVRRLGYEVEVLYWITHPAERFAWVAAVFKVEGGSA
jgi:hypothetical protein